MPNPANNNAPPMAPSKLAQVRSLPTPHDLSQHIAALQSFQKTAIAEIRKQRARIDALEKLLAQQPEPPQHGLLHRLIKEHLL